MKLVDTDVLIWNLRGAESAARYLDGLGSFGISAVSWMELVQGVRDKRELRLLREALRFWRAELHLLDPATTGRAIFLVESYGLSHGMQMADALIAATAIERGAGLVTANDRHYRHVPGLEIQIFRP